MQIPSGEFPIANTPLPWWSPYPAVDAGWLYIIRNGELLKIGKTTNPKRRLREARTWLPYVEIIGIKPFWCIHDLERTLLCGIANFWCEGEWHEFPDDSWADVLIVGFRQFTDDDRNRNTVDFSYWIGGSGMGEVIMEQNRRQISLSKWQREAGAG